MSADIILASGSKIRAQLLTNAGLNFTVSVPSVDEDAVRASLLTERASPRDVADVLADLKALRVAAHHPDAIVIGCDQVLALGHEIYAKPQTPADALLQLQTLRGQTHQLLSAVVIYGEGRALWRHVGAVRLHMRDASDTYLTDYVDRNWDSIRHSVGAYKLEEEGVRLLKRIDGDYFNVLGLPLLELLSYLMQRGTLPS